LEEEVEIEFENESKTIRMEEENTKVDMRLLKKGPAENRRF